VTQLTHDYSRRSSTSDKQIWSRQMELFSISVSRSKKTDSRSTGGLVSNSSQTTRNHTSTLIDCQHYGS